MVRFRRRQGARQRRGGELILKAHVRVSHRGAFKVRFEGNGGLEEARQEARQEETLETPRRWRLAEQRRTDVERGRTERVAASRWTGDDRTDRRGARGGGR